MEKKGNPDIQGFPYSRRSYSVFVWLSLLSKFNQLETRGRLPAKNFTPLLYPTAWSVHHDKLVLLSTKTPEIGLGRLSGWRNLISRVGTGRLIGDTRISQCAQ